ncbi:FAD-binding protein [Tessaracoccus sp. OS52]|uniref:D-arabinono-1,4-lactone oxidase n=1 Tax=Tessaracoccus sp. OS52 TaxID=2886691 RepID=UPI001D11829F|nr:D-arabinono-1,4-lactone oxidase [Tessaracoccus sp. OS52]MCC2593178.1 FAD-binding protein [Tessaracoccus sp. OS52]
MVERNWAGNVVYGAERLLQPRGLDELADLVSSSPQVRVLGTRHSFNNLADTAGTLVSLQQIPVDPERDVVVDAGARTVRAPGWMRYGELTRVLTGHGLALANLASLPHISIAGAVATGTHGSGDRSGSLATQVVGLDILDGLGDLHRLRRGDVGFDGAVVSLGALGIVTHVTLAVEPAYDVAQTVFEGATWDHVLGDLDGVTGAGDSVSLFTTWGDADLVDQVWVKTRLGREPRAPLPGLRPADGPRHPIPGIDATPATQQLGILGPWYDRLPHFRLEFTPSAGEEIQSEYLVPRARAVAAIESVRALAPRISPILQVCEVRTVAADSLWLSAAHERDVVGLHFTWVKDPAAVAAVLPELEAVLPEEARPHWGKVFADHGRVAGLYPRARDFRQLREQFDPERRFANDYLHRVGLV